MHTTSRLDRGAGRKADGRVDRPDPDRPGFGIRGENAMTMRYVYIALVVVFTAIVLLFMFQNLESATISFFTASITLPVSVLVLLTYVLGMLTGGSVLALVRAGVQRAQSTPPR
jgi:lipopolysaccharide assembly protein A